jgi:hypothetical protein
MSDDVRWLAKREGTTVAGIEQMASALGVTVDNLVLWRQIKDRVFAIIRKDPNHWIARLTLQDMDFVRELFDDLRSTKGRDTSATNRRRRKKKRARTELDAAAHRFNAQLKLHTWDRVTLNDLLTNDVKLRRLQALTLTKIRARATKLRKQLAKK